MDVCMLILRGEEGLYVYGVLSRLVGCIRPFVHCKRNACTCACIVYAPIANSKRNSDPEGKSRKAINNRVSVENADCSRTFAIRVCTPNRGVDRVLD